MVCFDWPDVMPQTVAGESMTERVVPEPKALEEDERYKMMMIVTVVKWVLKEEEDGGFFIKENGN
jgi:hypothetical protein